ncbi:MAG: hypothetical protein LBE83_05335, partial [Propionibacteriaceae bacterium]|nr:hypothetical protein [Propionibacteriaceae bacterium]
MLKKALIAVCLGLIFGITVVAEPVALAKDAGSCGKDVNAGSWGNVSSEIDCPSQNGGDTSGSGGGGSDGKCHNSSGQEVECIYLDRY